MDQETRPIRAILIAGPTASGKSRLGLALARLTGGVVVNADASQVYGDLKVLTARPDAEDERAAPHLLYGHVDAAEPYAVGRWLAEAGMVINRLRTDVVTDFEQSSDGAATAQLAPRTAIFVGGTGLYFDALINGLAEIPAIPEDIRARWRAFGPAGALHAELIRRDPEMAKRLRPTDPQRLMRALEVIDATGRSLAEWQAETTEGLLDQRDTLKIALAPDRAALDLVIARRLETMAAAGAVEEAARLTDRGLDPSLPAMKALGVSAFSAVARTELALEDAIERTRLDTRRYAKRQSTWFRNRMADWIHVPPQEAEGVVRLEIERRGLSAQRA